MKLLEQFLKEYGEMYDEFVEVPLKGIHGSDQFLMERMEGVKMEFDTFRVQSPGNFEGNSKGMPG